MKLLVRLGNTISNHSLKRNELYHKLDMKTLFFFLLSLITITLSAQQVSVSEQIPLRLDSRFDIVGKSKGKTLVFMNKLNEFDLMAFTDDMKMAWEKEIEFEKKNPKILGTLASNDDSFILFYTLRHKNQTFLKAKEYDYMGNLVDTTSIKDFPNQLHQPNLQMYHSPDKTKVLLYEIAYNNIKTVFVYDIQTSKVLWEDSFEEVSLSTNGELDQIVVDNDGNIYLILPKDNFPSKNKTHYFEIIERNHRASKKDIYTIYLDSILTYDNYFEFDNLNQNLVAGGLYSTKNRGRAEGTYYLTIPKGSPTDFKITHHPFDQATIEEFLDKPKTKNKGIDETDVKETLFRRDGGALMISEQVKLSSRGGGSAYSNAYGRSGRDYFYNNLLINSFHPSGELHWQRVLHKKQYSYDDDGAFSSYFLMKTPSSIRLVFNDDIRTGNTVSEYILRGDGTHERNSILNTESEDLHLQFSRAVQVSSTELIVPSEYRNKLRFVRIEY